MIETVMTWLLTWLRHDYWLDQDWNVPLFVKCSIQGDRSANSFRMSRGLLLVRLSYSGQKWGGQEGQRSVLRVTWRSKKTWVSWVCAQMWGVCVWQEHCLGLQVYVARAAIDLTWKLGACDLVHTSIRHRLPASRAICLHLPAWHPEAGGAVTRSVLLTALSSACLSWLF